MFLFLMTTCRCVHGIATTVNTDSENNMLHNKHADSARKCAVLVYEISDEFLKLICFRMGLCVYCAHDVLALAA